MSNISNMLRAIADEIEMSDAENQEKLKVLESMIIDVNTIARKNADKLKKIGMIMLEDDYI